MALMTFLFVIGTFAALVGTVLADSYERGSRAYKVCRGLSILGVMSLGLGLLLFLSSSFGSAEKRKCDDLGGLYLPTSSLCIDDDKLPQLPTD